MLGYKRKEGVGFSSREQDGCEKRGGAADPAP